MLKLNLPKPSNELLQAIFKQLKDATVNEFDQSRFENKNSNINVAKCLYFESNDITKFSESEYGHFFPGHTMYVIGLCLRNIAPPALACFPPHADKLRTTALNYIIAPGGQNVKTVTYNCRGNEGRATGTILSYSDDLQITDSHAFAQSTWCGLDVVQVHSVEDIENERLLLSISFADLTLADIEQKYKHLVSY